MILDSSFRQILEIQVYEARYLEWNCELKTRQSDIVAHLRNNCPQIVIIAVIFFLFFLFYSIMRFKENSLPDS